MRILFALILVLVAGGAQAQACSGRLLVSGYFSGNVHVYDVCTGQFQANLDGAGRLAGAQASAIGPDGHLYVVAETAGRIVRYRADTLAYIDDAVVLPAGFNATGMAFRGSDEIWLASYSQNVVRRFSVATGQPLGDAVPAGAAGLAGADNGMAFGPDGKLYVPGYDSDSVIRFDPATGVASTFIAPRTGGLRRARGLLFEPSGDSVLVSSEGSGAVLRYALSDGRFVAAVVTGRLQPTGLAYHPDGSLLVVDSTGVTRHNPQTGAPLGQLTGATQVAGPTYLTVLGAAGTGPDPSQIGSQFWIAGETVLADRTLQFDNLYTSNGASFGPAFDPGTVVRKRWGSGRIVFTACDRATFQWDATGAGSAGMGAGSYPLQRLLDGPATVRCRAQGFAATTERDWIAGGWWGGESRSGEGLMIDIREDGAVFLAWFTYRPAPADAG
jgi:sugar lactone lactonase YvrE